MASEMKRDPNWGPGSISISALEINNCLVDAPHAMAAGSLDGSVYRARTKS